MVIFAIMLVFDPLAVLLLIAGNINLKPREEVIEPTDEEVKETKEWFEKIRVKSKKLDEDKIEVKKENITSIEADNRTQEPEMKIPVFANELYQMETVNTGPGKYEERIVPIKKLEPKYDYEAELAFREKENK